VENVRAPAFGERTSLAYSEPVLLVDDNHREIVEVDLLLDQCVRADDERSVAGCDELSDGSVLARTQGARQQGDSDPEAAQ
jgi:hypothetical protein